MYLTDQDVGSRVIQDVTGIDRRTVYMIRSRRVRKIQARTADLILSVHPDARADRSLVGAGPTWRILNWLLSEGLTKKELARRLGSRAKHPILQLRTDYVTARNAMKVAKLFAMMMTGGDESPEYVLGRTAEHRGQWK